MKEQYRDQIFLKSLILIVFKGFFLGILFLNSTQLQRCSIVSSSFPHRLYIFCQSICLYSLLLVLSYLALAGYNYDYSLPLPHCTTIGAATVPWVFGHSPWDISLVGPLVIQRFVVLWILSCIPGGQWKASEDRKRLSLLVQLVVLLTTWPPLSSVSCNASVLSLLHWRRLLDYVHDNLAFSLRYMHVSYLIFCKYLRNYMQYKFLRHPGCHWT